MLPNLIGTIFLLSMAPNSAFRRNRSAVSSNCDDNRCLQFLWRENPEQRIEVYEDTRHVFGAESTPTSAKYAEHQVAKNRKIIRNTSNILLKLSSKIFSRTTSSSYSEQLEKQSKSTKLSKQPEHRRIQFYEMNNA